MKKFYIRKTNPIKNNTDPLNIVPNPVSAEEPWHLTDDKNKENKLIKGNNQNKSNTKVIKNIKESSEDKNNTNKSINNKKKEKFINIFISKRV